jgi:serine/threonine protein kinase/formylglycine-generating enzyme required for sulfatase activity
VTEEQIFLAALDRPDAVARNAYLGEACGENASLRQQVEALLASHFKSGEFLDIPAAAQIHVGTGDDCAVTIQRNAMLADNQPVDESDSLEFLVPSTRPDSLGRIGHYEVLQVLGKGGFGIVFRAFDDVLQRVVAVKVMAPQLAATSPARKRFLREARTSAQVRHDNVVQVYEVGEQPLPYLVMEFIPGETLQQRIDRMGPLDVPETVRIGRQIAEGLAAAHATDLIHRDIKPGNVLLEGGQHKVKITDFGLARAADDASMTQSGTIAGTPMYMAPEQVVGQTLDQRADLFSLGSVLYQMVAGRPPFRANTTVAVLKRVAEDTPRNIREVIPETPQWLCDIIAKLHAKKPDDRYQSAREVADVLADCEEQLKQNSRLRDFSRIPQAKSVPRRSIPKRWTAAAVVLLIVLAGWFGSTPVLYFSNRGELKLMPEEGLISVIVLENNEGDLVADKLHTPMTDWLDLTEKSHTLKLPPGRYQLNVSTWPAGTRVSQWAISNTGPFGSEQVTVPVINSSAIVTVERGHRVTLRAVISKPVVVPTPVAVAPATTDGWVQLFNGKDLTGWQTLPEQPGTWEVKDGILRGTKRQSHLFSTRNDYGNFHLRAEVKINLGGDSGILFRAPLELRRGRTPSEFGIPGCYEAELQQNRIHSRPTGSISEASGDAPPTILGRVLDTSLTEPDEWFTYEVIAENNHFITKINGSEAANCSDLQGKHQTGHLALQVWQANTLVQFRKIEIKELPASNSPSSALAKRRFASDEWIDVIPLIDPQLDKWDMRLTGKNQWRIEHGELVVGDADNQPSKLLLPLDADFRPSFECELEFTRREGDLGFNLNFPTTSGDTSVNVYALSKRGIFLRMPRTGVTQIAEGPQIETGKRTTFHVTVERQEVGDRIGVSINGELVGTWTGDRNELASLNNEGYPHKRRLSLWVYGGGNEFVFHRIRVRMLHGGVADALRPVPSALPPAVAKPESPPTFKNSLGMEFVIVPKGKSWLGGGKDKLGDQEVEFPADFYLGKYEVTQEEWTQVMGENPSHFSRTGEGKDAVKDIPDADLQRFPVEMVSWDQCQLFVEGLNKLEKQTGWIYRLPTELEWEHACRGGGGRPAPEYEFDYYFGQPTNTLLQDQANFNFSDEAQARTCQVGSYKPNRLGLDDMHGNVWEWCQNEVIDQGVSKRPSLGGGWEVDSGNGRAWFRRTPHLPSQRHPTVGLRLARVPSDAPAPAAEE